MVHNMFHIYYIVKFVFYSTILFISYIFSLWRVVTLDVDSPKNIELSSSYCNVPLREHNYFTAA